MGWNDFADWKMVGDQEEERIGPVAEVAVEAVFYAAGEVAAVQCS